MSPDPRPGSRDGPLSTERFWWGTAMVVVVMLWIITLALCRGG
jgi:hypothetical protein